jgi:hypothetical protein
MPHVELEHMRRRGFGLHNSAYLQVDLEFPRLRGCCILRQDEDRGSGNHHPCRISIS